MIGAEVRTLSRRAGERARRAAAHGAQPRPAGRRAVRHDAEGHLVRGPPRRDLRHRRRRRQRPERAVPGALGRAPGRRAPTWSGSTSARSGASAPAAGARLGLCCVPEERNGHGACPTCRWSRTRVLSGRHRMGLAASGFIRSRRGGDASPSGSSASSTSGRPARRPPPARSPAATCRSSSSAARSCRTRACWWSRSRPGGSTPAPRPRSTRRCSTSPSAGAAVLVISQDLDELLTLTDRLAVINVGVLSGTLATAERLARRDRPADGRPARHGRARARATRERIAHVA